MNRLISHRLKCSKDGEVADFDAYLDKNGTSQSGLRSGLPEPLEAFIQSRLAEDRKIKPTKCLEQAKLNPRLNALLTADEDEKRFLRRVTNARQHLNKIDPR